MSLKLTKELSRTESKWIFHISKESWCFWAICRVINTHRNGHPFRIYQWSTQLHNKVYIQWISVLSTSVRWFKVQGIGLEDAAAEYLDLKFIAKHSIIQSEYIRYFQAILPTEIEKTLWRFLLSYSVQTVFLWDVYPENRWMSPRSTDKSKEA